MLEMNSRTQMAGRPEMGTRQARPSSKQNVRLLIALSLLLVALAVVLVKDREFWFGSTEAIEANASPENTPQVAAAAPAKTLQAKTVQAPAARAATAKLHNVSKAQPAVIPSSSNDTASPAPVVATNRVVLPPLDVEVVAGDTHRTVHPGSNATKVEIPGDSNRVSAATASPSLPANAAERQRLSPVSAPELRQNIDTTLPLLGQHMKVQGSVVLQAVIGADGSIENLSVLSGPAILATAAQQAVRQWRFKPYLQNGQPVETKTRITVNFSIRVADNPATTS
ncbi:MAG TPA: energy transducer TonB [Candidatus Dormibacteraeota bacterium]|jgi:TonB family protein|nr:energy transducer TonB [Candidatus Dormibacteraeota bacterium]